MKQAYLKDIFVIHPPRDYKPLVRKFNRIYNGDNDLVVLYPERFRLPQISLFDCVKEFFRLPRNVPRDSRFNYLNILFFFWWIDIVKIYKKKTLIKGTKGKTRKFL